MNSWSSSESLAALMGPGPTREETLLEEAEQRDSYRRACADDKVNSLARQHSQYIPHSSHEGSLFLDKVPSWLRPIAEKSRIVWMHPSADAGLPHTRPGMLVCIPMYYPRERFGETLAHELIHCWQRMTPGAWKDVYAAQGWRKARDDEVDKIPDEFLHRVRINPDTMMSGAFWVWSERYIPMALFQRVDKPALRETDVRWFDLETGYSYRSPPADFQRYFGPVSDPEHPAEVAAYSLADPGTFRGYPAWETFRGLVGAGI